MKKLFLFAAALTAFSMGSAQSIYYQDKGNVDMMRHTLRDEVLRNEIILPKVNDYIVLKSDLHIHTFYSDGSVTPEYRVQEAWSGAPPAGALRSLPSPIMWSIVGGKGR